VSEASQWNPSWGCEPARLHPEEANVFLCTSPAPSLTRGWAPEQVDTPGKKLLVGVAVTYLALVLLVPTLNVFVQAFAKGPGPFFGHLTDPDFLHAVRVFPSFGPKALSLALRIRAAEVAVAHLHQPQWKPW